MKKVLFCIFLCLMPRLCFSQVVLFSYALNDCKALDTTRYVLQYKMNFMIHPKSEYGMHQDIRKVQVGSRIVKDYSAILWKWDSLATENYNKGLNMYNPTNKDILNIYPLEVYNSYTKNSSKITYRLTGKVGVLYWTEPDAKLNWKLEGTDTVKVLGYSCQRASVSWGGRNYIAWFSPDIPINAGPYRFRGLPGLIMKVKEATNMYSWELQGLEQKKEPINEYRYDPMRKSTNREKAINTINRMYDTPLAFMLSAGQEVYIRRKDGRYGKPTAEDETHVPFEYIEK